MELPLSTAELGEITFDRAKKAADEQPQLFLEYLQEAQDSLKPFELSFAAEALGHYRESCSFLVSLLKHKDATVREGAILGLAQIGGDEATKALFEAAKTDISSVVRSVATECLKERK